MTLLVPRTSSCRSEDQGRPGIASVLQKVKYRTMSSVSAPRLTCDLRQVNFHFSPLVSLTCEEVPIMPNTELTGVS